MSTEEDPMRPLLWLTALAFGAYSFWVMAQIGYFGIWRAGFESAGSLQILLDLVISSLLLIGFVARDAKDKGRSWWPWAVLTAVAGSFGTLGYLLWPHSPHPAARPVD
jgi:cytochrome bd-type quinol oxidase subunit 2